MKKDKNNIEIHVKESVEFIRSQISVRPKIAIILGSGLGDFADILSEKTIVPTTLIPHFPQSTVEGHKGNITLGKLHRTTVLVFQGRVHFYETGSLETVLFPIRVAHGLNIRTLLVTNAAGGVNKEFTPGDLMLIKDQINLTFENPLKGFLSSSSNSDLYDNELQKIIRNVAKENNIPLREGIYCGIKGPSYETAAEVEMIRLAGADAVGMSTVNEVTFANALGMRIGGISCITNLSTGILNQKLSHHEVTDIANKVKDSFRELLMGVIQNVGRE